MLSTLTSLVAVVVLNTAISPAPGVETLKYRDTSYMLTQKGMLSFSIVGPVALHLEFRAPPTLNRKRVPLELVRNTRYSSSNSIRFQKRRGGPRGYTTQARLDVAVPEGQQTYHVKIALTEGMVLAVFASAGGKVSSKLTAAVEIEMEMAPPQNTATATPEDLMPSKTGLESIAALPADESPRTFTKAIRVAVYDFKVEGVDQNIANVVTDSMLAEVRKLKGVAAIGMEEIRDMLSHEANKQILGCESDESCLAEIAGALGVDFLITGTLSKAAESHIIDVKRIDQGRAQIAGAVNKRLKAGSGQEFLLAVGPIIEELFPEREMKPGRERGVPDEVALRLDPPPLPTWGFWSVAGASGAALAAGGVFGLLKNDSQRQFNRLSKESIQPGADPINGANYVGFMASTQDRAQNANMLFGVGAGLAISAAVMYLFTDWDGYGDAEP